jgi:hypothetical protein
MHNQQRGFTTLEASPTQTGLDVFSASLMSYLKAIAQITVVISHVPKLLMIKYLLAFCIHK